MPECHKCKWNGKGNLEACLRCAGLSDQLSSHGQTFVSLDAVPDSSFIEQQQIEQDASSSGVTNLPPEAEETFRSFLFELFNLSDESLLLVKWVYGGGTLSAFAESHNVSRQHISKMSYKICSKIPMLAPLFKRKLNQNSGEIEGRFHQDEFYLK